MYDEAFEFVSYMHDAHDKQVIMAHADNVQVLRRLIRHDLGTHRTMSVESFPCSSGRFDAPLVSQLRRPPATKISFRSQYRSA
eukprot:COSAG04_NODE_4240_length_2212_cov_12.780880_4_plen_83_part_00